MSCKQVLVTNLAQYGCQVRPVAKIAPAIIGNSPVAWFRMLRLQDLFQKILWTQEVGDELRKLMPMARISSDA